MKNKKTLLNIVCAIILIFCVVVMAFLGYIIHDNNSTRSNNDSNQSTVQEQTAEQKHATDKNEKNTEKLADPSVMFIMYTAEITEAQAKAVFSDFNKVGIDKIIDIEALSANETDKSFKFSSDKISGILVITNGKTSYISSGGLVLFDIKKGGALANANDYILSDSDKNYYKGMAEEHVKQFLKTPSTAQFPNLNDTSAWIVSRYLDTVTVSAWVNSQNSYGAMLQSDFIIQMSYTSKGTVLTYAEVEDTPVYGTFKSY